MALSIDSMVKNVYFHTSIKKNIKKNWILVKKVWMENDVFNLKNKKKKIGFGLGLVIHG